MVSCEHIHFIELCCDGPAVSIEFKTIKIIVLHVNCKQDQEMRQEKFNILSIIELFVQYWKFAFKKKINNEGGKINSRSNKTTTQFK